MISTHFPPQHLGGDAKFVEYLATELVRHGHEVHIFHNPAVYGFFRKSDQIDDPDAREYLISRHPYESRFGRIDPPLALTLGYSKGARIRLTELSNKIKPDVVHWHNTRAFIGAPTIISNEISLYTSHDYSSICPRSNLLKPDLSVCNEAHLCTFCTARWGKPPQIWRISNRRVVRYPKSTRILSPSEFVARRLREEGLPAHTVLRNFVPDSGKNTPRNTTDLDSLVYLGMLEKHKGVMTLLKAFIRSSGKHGLRLHVIGEGSLRGQLAELVTKHAMNERIIVHGFLNRENVEQIRRKAVAQVLPSEWYENSPLTALEGLSLGVPILGADIGGIPEIVGPDSGGVRFRSGSIDELSDLLVWTWNNREALRNMGNRARKAYETRFTPQVHLAQYIKIINETAS